MQSANRLLMRLRLAMGLALAILAMLAPSASAWERLPYKKLNPNSRETFSPQGLPGIPFSLTSPVERMTVTVLVSPSPSPGLDGLIVPGDAFPLQEKADDRGNYRGISNGAPMWWTTRVGTYYWQIMAVTKPPVHVYFGPVRSFRIG